MHKEIISIIGAGGKTTLIHRLADEYRKQNNKVLDLYNNPHVPGAGDGYIL